MRAMTGLIRADWDLLSMTTLEGITKIVLHNPYLDLKYTLEHHARSETFEASPLLAFIRTRATKSNIAYERESLFPDAEPAVKPEN
jgi:hypothetical protein